MTAAQTIERSSDLRPPLAEPSAQAVETDRTVINNSVLGEKPAILVEAFEAGTLMSVSSTTEITQTDDRVIVEGPYFKVEFGTDGSVNISFKDAAIPLRITIEHSRGNIVKYPSYTVSALSRSGFEN